MRVSVLRESTRLEPCEVVAVPGGHNAVGEASNDSKQEPTGQSDRRSTGSGRWSSEDKALFRATWRLWPLPVLGALLTLLVVGFATTKDGAHYLELGNILLNGGFPDQWDFIREPGLPILLRLTALSHLGAPGYLVVSGLMAGLAFSLVGGAFYDLGRHWQRLLLGALGLSASIYISYAGFVLQQTGMAFLLALFGWSVRFLQTGKGVKLWRLVCMGLLGAVSLYYSFVFATIVGLVTAIAVGLLWCRRRLLNRRQLISAAVGVALVAVIPAVAYLPWENLKADHPPPLVTGGHLVDRHAAKALDNATGPNRVYYLRDRLAVVLTLLHFPDVADQVKGSATKPSREDHVWAVSRAEEATAAENCQLFVFGGDPDTAASQRLTDLMAGRDYCTPINGSAYLAGTVVQGYKLGAIASTLMLFGTLWAIWRRRELVPVLLLPWGWIAMYSLFLPIDRYAIPVWPYKIMFGFLLVFAMWQAAFKVPPSESSGGPATSDAPDVPVAARVGEDNSDVSFSGHGRA